MKFTRKFLGGFVLTIGVVFAGIGFVYAQTAPTIRQVSSSQGAPGTLIEFVGQFDTNVEYQVKFGEVLVPGYMQQNGRLITMVPVLSNEQRVQVSVKAVEAESWELALETFRVLALPVEMTAQELKEELVEVGQAFEKAMASLHRTDRILNDGGGPISFKSEMSKLNVVWGVIGNRIDSLVQEDVDLLGELLQNSGGLDIIRSLAQTASIASEQMDEGRFLSHYVFFHLDRLSFLINKGNVVLDLATFVALVWPGGQPVAVILSGISTVSTLTKDVIDIVVPTDLDSIRIQEQTWQLSVGDTANVLFVGKFDTQNSIISRVVDNLASFIGRYVSRLVTRTDVAQNIRNYHSSQVVGIFVEAGLDTEDMVTASKLANLRFRSLDVPLDMSLYRRDANSRFIHILELVGVSLSPGQFFAPVTVADKAVARYNTDSAQLIGLMPDTTRLQMQGYKFIDERTVVGPFYWNFGVVDTPE